MSLVRLLCTASASKNLVNWCEVCKKAVFGALREADCIRLAAFTSCCWLYVEMLSSVQGCRNHGYRASLYY
jgi:hypothetical protein